VSQLESAVVVGAGLSGLAAARTLEKAGVRTTVLEASGGPGGRAQTERIGEYLVDTGPDAATAGYTRWLALVEDLGLTSKLTEPSAVLGVVKDGLIVEIDATKPLQALRAPFLTPRAKLRLAAGTVKLLPTLRNVDSYEMGRMSALDDPASSARALSYATFGGEVTERLIDPVLRLVTGSGASEASTLSLFGALTAWSSPIVNIEGGLGSVAHGVAAGLQDIRYETEVTGVADEPGGVTVTYRGFEDGASTMVRADGCVIAAMHHRARQIWPALDALAPGFAPALRDVSLVAVSLGYRRRPATDAYAVIVPTIEDRDTLLIFMQHNKAPDRAPDGHGLITLYTLATPAYLDRSDAEIEAWAAGVIERLCPELAGHREMAVVTRWPTAGYLASPGFWRRSKELSDAIPADGRVQIGGDLFGAGSMESAVRWGERAAERLLAPRRAD
jgi:oxygen-dependent protoporphyrinogen oxidase